MSYPSDELSATCGPPMSESSAAEKLADLRRYRDEALESDRARNTPGWEKTRAVIDYAIAEVSALTTRLAEAQEKHRLAEARIAELGEQLRREESESAMWYSQKVAAEARLAEMERQHGELMADLERGYDFAQLAASYWPESPGVWTGTVCERLGRLMTLEHEGRESAEQLLSVAEERIQDLKLIHDNDIERMKELEQLLSEMAEGLRKDGHSGEAIKGVCPHTKRRRVDCNGCATLAKYDALRGERNG